MKINIFLQCGGRTLWEKVSDVNNDQLGSDVKIGTKSVAGTNSILNKTSISGDRC